MKCHTSQLLVALLATGAATAQNTSLEKSEREAVVEKVGDMLTANYVFPDGAALVKGHRLACRRRPRTPASHVLIV
jgi:hypothetical protein